MNIAPLADVKARFSEYVKKTQQVPIVVTKNGRPVAVLLGIHDEDELERILLATRPNFKLYWTKPNSASSRPAGWTTKHFGR